MDLETKFSLLVVIVVVQGVISFIQSRRIKRLEQLYKAQK